MTWMATNDQDYTAVTTRDHGTVNGGVFVHTPVFAGEEWTVEVDALSLYGGRVTDRAELGAIVTAPTREAGIMRGIGILQAFIAADAATIEGIDQ